MVRVTQPTHVLTSEEKKWLQALVEFKEARIHHMRENCNSSISTLDKVLEKAPNFAFAMLNRGMSYERRAKLSPQHYALGIIGTQE